MSRRNGYSWKTSWAFRRWALRIHPYCQWCGKHLTKELRATTDHIIPVVKGGSDQLDNLCLACRPCNENRGSDDIPHLPLGPKWQEVWDKQHNIKRRANGQRATRKLPDNLLYGQTIDGKWHLICRHHCQSKCNKLIHKLQGIKDCRFVGYKIEVVEPLPQAIASIVQ